MPLRSPSARIRGHRCTPRPETRAPPRSPPITPWTRSTGRRSPSSPPARRHLVVVGPEAPLVAGVAERSGPPGSPASARRPTPPGSKAPRPSPRRSWRRPACPPPALTSADTGEIAAALADFGPPYVVKDDGLAAGKGVVVTDDRAAAVAHALHCQRVVVEEYLDGPEVSLFGVCDGRTVRPMQPAQDFKRVGDGDAGPNTGGMGAYTPLPWARDDLSTRSPEPSCSRRSTSWPGGGHRSSDCCTRGWR